MGMVIGGHIHKLPTEVQALNTTITVTRIIIRFNLRYTLILIIEMNIKFTSGFKSNFA